LFKAEIELIEDKGNKLLEFLESVRRNRRNISDENLEKFGEIHNSETFGSDLKMLSNVILIGSHPQRKELANIYCAYEQKFHQQNLGRADVCLKQRLVRLKLQNNRFGFL